MATSFSSSSPSSSSLSALFDLRPVVDQQKLWSTVSARFHSPPVGYLRKMGFAEKRPLPTCTLDMFFTVKTQQSDDDVNKAEAFVTLVPVRDLGSMRDFMCLNPDICRYCFNTLVKVVSQGFEVCVDCGTQVSNPEEVATCATSSFGGTVGSSAGGRRLTTYIYKRTNHFLDHLKRVQAKQSSSVKPEILSIVENELRKERILRGDSRITTAKIRAILKKLKLQKHYTYVFQITAKLSGRAPPSLTPVQEEKLLEMFQSIQGPFDKHCPPDRTNMLNYSYILRKFTQILGWHELMDFFPLLKSRSKVHSQDILWKKICEEANFPFHKSIA
jgi:hypothetical protein